MGENTDGIIGILCAISLASIATFGITQTVQTQKELERIQIEYRGYQEGVKDSR